jgi:hypothetical protein
MSDDDKLRISLGGQSFVLKKIPMARFKVITSTLSNIFKEFGDKKLEDTNVLDALLDRVLEFPHEILSIFIKDLPKEIFLDEEDGVSFPEFIEALEKAIEINRLDKLKGFFSKLAPALAQTMATTQLKTK